MRMLIVDDDLTLEACAAALSARGYETRSMDGVGSLKCRAAEARRAVGIEAPIP